MILDIAKVLKTVKFPSTVKFSITSVLISPDTVFFHFKFFIIKKIYSSASDTRSRTPMPPTSLFNLSGFKPKRSENLSKAFITCVTESLLLTNRHKQNIRIYC